MIEPEFFYNLLKSNKIDFFTGVPDSLLKDFCAYVNENVSSTEHIITANEGSAIALASGYNLATGKIPLVYMQNSGLGNAINPLVSLADKEVYKIPMLLLVGWRGEPEIADEPQHKKMGQITLGILDTIGVPYTILDKEPEEVAKQMISVLKHLQKNHSPYVLVVKKKVFAPYSVHKKNSNVSEGKLKREEALSLAVASLNPKAVVVSTTGKLSRELYEIREKLKTDHKKDFLTVGSMGHASQIALGIALSRPERSVYCFDGDGAAIMHMGGMAIIGQQKPNNFRHILFNNGMHESVGGQPTAGFDIDFCKIALACGYKKALKATDKDSVDKALRDVEKTNGPVFLEIILCSGSREDLSRPNRSPQENKADFESFLRS